MVTQKYLAELFVYRDGVLYWRISRTNRVRAGSAAGCCRRDNGRCVITLDGKHTYAHRLIFMLHHGWTPDEIDHIDQDPANNRIENLRAATRAQNQSNSRRRKDNSSGIKNVCWYAPTKKWTAQAYVNGRRKRLGYFEDKFAAAAAVAKAQRAQYGEFASPGELK